MDLGEQMPPTDRVLFGSKCPYKRAIFGGPPRANSQMLHTDSGDTEFWRLLARLSDDANFRSDPTLTRASPGLRSQNNSLKLVVIVFCGVTI